MDELENKCVIELKDDKSKFLSSYEGMIKKIANNYYIPTQKYDFDDLVSVGNSAALKAHELFDSTRGVSETTYVYCAARNNIAEFITLNSCDIHASKETLRKNFKSGETNQFKAISLSDMENAEDVIPSGAPKTTDVVEHKESINLMMDKVSSLPSREKKVITERFFRGKTFLDIACDLGISKQRVKQIEKNTLKKLRGQLENKIDL